MSDDVLLERIRSMHAQLAPSSKHMGYPPAFRELVVAYAQDRRQEGWTWKAIGERLPVGGSTARAWAGGSHPREASSSPTSSLVAVQVIEDPAPASTHGSGLTLTTPSGYRLTGMSLDQAAVLLGRL